MSSSGMDIRLPMGMMFAILGAIIAAYGLLRPAHASSLGFPIDLIWGLVLLALGVLMVLMAIAAKKGKH